MVRALGTIKAYYDYGMFQPIQIAAIMALRHTDAAVEAQSVLYQRRRDVLCDGLRRIGWDITPPRAGMFVWAKIPEPWASQMDTMDFAMKLLEEGRRRRQPRQRLRPGRRRLSCGWRWSRTKTACGRPCGRSAAAWAANLAQRTPLPAIRARPASRLGCIRSVCHGIRL